MIKGDDYVTPAERLARTVEVVRWPFWCALWILCLIGIIALSDYISRWGDASPLVEFIIGRSCGY